MVRGVLAAALVAGSASAFKGSVTSELSAALKTFGAPLRTVGLVSSQAGGEIARALCGGDVVKRVNVVPPESSDSPAIAVIDSARSSTEPPSAEALAAMLASDVVLYAVGQHELTARYAGTPRYLLALLAALEQQLEVYDGTPDKKKTLVVAVTDACSDPSMPEAAVLKAVEKDVRGMWAALAKPQQFETASLDSLFELRFACLPHAKFESVEFEKRLESLKRSALFSSTEAVDATQRIAEAGEKAELYGKHSPGSSTTTRAEVEAHAACESAMSNLSPLDEEALRVGDEEEDFSGYAFAEACESYAGEVLEAFDAETADEHGETATYSRKRRELQRQLGEVTLRPARLRRLESLVVACTKRASKAGSQLRVQQGGSLKADTKEVVKETMKYFDEKVPKLQKVRGSSLVFLTTDEFWSQKVKSARASLEDSLLSFFEDRLAQLQVQGAYTPAPKKLWPTPVALQFHWLVPTLGRELASTGLTDSDRRSFNIIEGEDNALKLPIPEQIKAFARGLVAKDPSAVDVAKDGLAESA